MSANQKLLDMIKDLRVMACDLEIMVEQEIGSDDAQSELNDAANLMDDLISTLKTANYFLGLS